MRRGGASAGLAVAFAAAMTSFCASKVVVAPHTLPVPAPERPRRDLVVLLPDADTGVTGRAIVFNANGTVDLATAGASTEMSPGHAPSPVSPMSDQDVHRVFGNALSALPPAPLHFVVYFRFDSGQLTTESRGQLPQILRATRDRPVPEVVVIGHTDTAGPAAQNLQLSLKRADAVRDLLLDTHLDPSTIVVLSYGEADLLVPTADDVFEPRNRRVEITVR